LDVHSSTGVTDDPLGTQNKTIMTHSNLTKANLLYRLQLLLPYLNLNNSIIVNL